MKLNEVKILANNLMNQFGVTDYVFTFDSSRVRFGQCRYNSHEIGISRYLASVNDEATVKETILHEIAHALSPKQGHNEVWKQTAVRIGARPERCYDITQVKRTPKYKMTCPNCSKQYEMNRMPKRGRKYVCRVDRTPLTIDNDPIQAAKDKLMHMYGMTIEEQDRLINEVN